MTGVDTPWRYPYGSPADGRDRVRLYHGAVPERHDHPESPAVLGDTTLQSSTLESLTSAHRYHAWLTDLARPYLGEHPVELGSGLGDYAATWLESGVPRITVTDADGGRLGVLRERFGGDDRVEVLGLDVFDPPVREHSCFVAFNVLEHIPDQVGALRAAYEQAGLTVERLHYVNAPGLPAWIVGMRLLGMTPGDGPTVRAWDRFVVPVARAIERRVRPPFGQSAFAVGRVPG